MSDVENARQKLAMCVQNLDSIGGYLSLAIQELEGVKAMAMDAAEGASGAASVQDVTGMVGRAEEDCETARQAVFAARNGAEEVANRL